MYVKAMAIWNVKEGNSESEFEDAFWPKTPIYEVGKVFRFAISDGASDAIFSKIWAKMLVRSFGRGNLLSSGLTSEFLNLQQRWRNCYQWQSLPWYLEEKARHGSFATLLAFQIMEDEPCDGCVTPKWTAMAIGDSCIFQVRDECIVKSFPIESSSMFTNRPHLLSTNPQYNSLIEKRICSTGGEIVAGDTFYLMTDAIACWFISEVENGRSPWIELTEIFCSVDNQDCFSRWLSRLRSSSSIRNDDVTVVRVVVD